MTNQDKKKGCLSGVFFMLAFIFPVISLLIGWIGGGWKIGTIAALVTFSLFFLTGSIFAIWIQTPSWFTIMLPAALGLGYSILPNLPLPFDDALVASAGATVSFALALRRYTDIPKWIIAPLLFGALYTIVGGIIPGPVDELLVSLISLGLPSAKVIQHQLASKSQEILSENSETLIEGEV